MKKFLILATILFVSSIALANRFKDVLSGDGDHPCGENCENSAQKCCSTAAGSVFYGKCSPCN
jgi:hypothetical protein